MKYCTACGSANPDEARFCQNCGTPIEEIANVGGEPVVATTGFSSVSGTSFHKKASYSQNNTPELAVHEKSEFLAVLLSFIIPGAGEIYVGKVSKGIFLIVLALILFFTLIGYFFIWIYAMFDSYNLAKRYNQLLYQTGIPPDPSQL